MKGLHLTTLRNQGYRWARAYAGGSERCHYPRGSPRKKSPAQGGAGQEICENSLGLVERSNLLEWNTQHTVLHGLHAIRAGDHGFGEQGLYFVRHHTAVAYAGLSDVVELVKRKLRAFIVPDLFDVFLEPAVLDIKRFKIEKT